MDWEPLLKIVGLIVTVIGLPKIWHEIHQMSDSRLKGNFAFAKEYTEALRKDAHPLVVEVGFSAFQRGRQLNAPEILYLLSLSQPSRSIRLFLKGRDRLDFVEGVPQGHASVGFKKKYKSSTKRFWLKGWYLLAYFTLASLALAPLIFLTPKFLDAPIHALVVGILPIATLGGLAYLMLISFASLYAAENFIKLQQADT